MGMPHMPHATERATVDRYELLRLETLHPRETWHEDYGDVLWWYVHDGDISEPPVIGREYDDDLPEYVTHWSHLPHVLTPGEIKRRSSR